MFGLNQIDAAMMEVQFQAGHHNLLMMVVVVLITWLMPRLLEFKIQITVGGLMDNIDHLIDNNNIPNM